MSDGAIYDRRYRTAQTKEWDQLSGAVALLDYHNGSVGRALIDLEKHGRLKNEDHTQKEGTKEMNGNSKKGETKEKALNFLQKLYRCRVKIRKGDTNIVNVSVLFGEDRSSVRWSAA